MVYLLIIKISFVDQFDNRVKDGYKYTVVEVSKDTIVLKRRYYRGYNRT